MTRKQRTFWIAFDPLVSRSRRFTAFASKAEAKAWCAELNVERRENGEQRLTVEGPFLVLEHAETL